MPSKRARSRSRRQKRKSPRQCATKCLVKRSPSQFNKTQCALTPGYHWVVGKGCVKMTEEELCCQPCAPMCPSAPTAAQPTAAQPTAAPQPASSQALARSQPPTSAVVPTNTIVVELSTNTFQQQELSVDDAAEYYWTSELRNGRANAGFEALRDEWNRKSEPEMLTLLNTTLQKDVANAVILSRNLETGSRAVRDNKVYMPRYPYDFQKRKIRWLLFVLLRKLRSQPGFPQTLENIQDELRKKCEEFVRMFTELSTSNVFKQNKGTLAPLDPPVSVDKTQLGRQEYCVFNFTTKLDERVSRAQYYKLFQLKNYQTGKYFLTVLKEVYNKTVETLVGAYVKPALLTLQLEYRSGSLNANDYDTRVRIVLQLAYMRLMVPYSTKAQKAYFDKEKMNVLNMSAFVLSQQLIPLHTKFSSLPERR